MKNFSAKIATVFLLFFTISSTYAQIPPDAPLTPQEWVDKMGIGMWWIFTIPPTADTNITTNYTSQIVDEFQTKFCINGGRLHWNADEMFDVNDELLQAPIDNLRAIIDDFMARDMAICLNVQFNTNAEEELMTPLAIARITNGWTKLCDEFKDVSHNFAMCPFIEFRGWDALPDNQRIDNLNALYDDLTLIFRANNPTRIMSYKPHGNAKRAQFQDLDYPFGNDVLPSSGQPFYYVSSFSGSAGMGDWGTWTPTISATDLDALHFQTMNAGSSDVTKVWGINSAIQHKQNTGIPFWCDHWRPNYHKHANDGNQWTMEQNLAYVDFFENKLLEIGSAGAGLQTRTFWSDTTNALIEQTGTSTDEEIMSVQFMDLLHQKCLANPLNIDNFENENKVSIFPNPFINTITVNNKGLERKDIKLYNLLGQEIKNLMISTTSSQLMEIKTFNLPKGVYLVKLKGVSKIIVKQ